MILNKASANKGVLIFLIAAIVLGVFLIIHQQNIIGSLKRALNLVQNEASGTSLEQAGDKPNARPRASVVNNDKYALMAELTQIKAKLNEAEDLLKQAQQEKDSLKQENATLSNAVAGLKEELRLWEGKISSLDERKLVTQRRNQSVRELRKRIWDLKAKAQREIDIVKMQLGNQGFLSRGGKSTFSREKIVQLEKIVVTRCR
ncbi:MAG: hypothetical protein WC546_02885 [Candidatus Omnitrophota bacterium]|jgi:chromosome segregation ATPase